MTRDVRAADPALEHLVRTVAWVGLPAVVLAMALAAALPAASAVVGEFYRDFGFTDGLPMPTILWLDASAHAHALIPAGVLVLAVAGSWLASAKGRMPAAERVVLALRWGAQRASAAGGFCSMLARELSRGIPAAEAVAAAGEASAWRTVRAEAAVAADLARRGASLPDALCAVRVLPGAALRLLRAAEPGRHPAALEMLGGLYEAAARRRSLAQATAVRAWIAAGALAMALWTSIAVALPLSGMMSRMASEFVERSRWQSLAEAGLALLPILAGLLLPAWLMAGVRAYARARRAAACGALAQALRGGLPSPEALLAIAEESGWRYRRWARRAMGKPLEPPAAYEGVAASLRRPSRLPRMLGVACVAAVMSSCSVLGWHFCIHILGDLGIREGEMGRFLLVWKVGFWLTASAAAAGLALLLRRPPLPLDAPPSMPYREGVPPMTPR